MTWPKVSWNGKSSYFIYFVYVLGKLYFRLVFPPSYKQRYSFFNTRGDYPCPLSLYDSSAYDGPFWGRNSDLWVSGFTLVRKNKSAGFSTEDRMMWELEHGYIWGLGFEVSVYSSTYRLAVPSLPLISSSYTCGSPQTDPWQSLL